MRAFKKVQIIQSVNQTKLTITKIETNTHTNKQTHTQCRCTHITELIDCLTKTFYCILGSEIFSRRNQITPVTRIMSFDQAEWAQCVPAKWNKFVGSFPIPRMNQHLQLK